MGRIELGVPTEYGYSLPRIRHQLAARYLPAPVDWLLDFGSGNGANTVLFADDAKHVVGVDVEPERIDEARRAAEHRGLLGVEYMLYDGERLPFADGSFDHAVSFEVLEHTTDDRQALAELRRVLRPDARMTLSVPNKWYPMETHGFHWRPTWVTWNRVPLLSWLPDPVHSRYAKARIYTRRRILRLLDDAGFDVLHTQYLMPPLDKIRRPALRTALRAVAAGLARTPLRVLGVAHVITVRRR
jgi:SAM-dependent methyltransferase